ncbi:MAG: hypothetical protein KY396_06045, partial [Actinobacteria bacterium]|nr:hypothetical protein [Actinomycetota bacterium]
MRPFESAGKRRIRLASAPRARVLRASARAIAVTVAASLLVPVSALGALALPRTAVERIAQSFAALEPHLFPGAPADATEAAVAVAAVVRAAGFEDAGAMSEDLAEELERVAAVVGLATHAVRLEAAAANRDAAVAADVTAGAVA